MVSVMKEQFGSEVCYEEADDVVRAALDPVGAGREAPAAVTEAFRTRYAELLPLEEADS